MQTLSNLFTQSEKTAQLFYNVLKLYKGLCIQFFVYILNITLETFTEFCKIAFVQNVWTLAL